MRSRGHEVVVWSSGRDIEQSVLKSWDGPVFSTKARQLRPKYLFSIFASYLRCVQELRRFRPAVVLVLVLLLSGPLRRQAVRGARSVAANAAKMPAGLPAGGKGSQMKFFTFPG